MRVGFVVLLVLFFFGGWVLNVEGLDIPSTTVASAAWQYFSLDLTTAPASTPVRAIFYFTVSGGGASVSLYTQYDTQPTATSNSPFNHTEMDTAAGKYFGSVTISKRTGSIYFGVYNSGGSGVTISGGRYYFAKEETLPDPFSLKGGDYTIQSGTATLFSLNVPEATSLALAFSLKFTALGAFQSEANNLLLRRDALPNIVTSDKWGVIDYQPNNYGVNGQGKELAGWEGWFRKGIISGDYYISLYNPESSDHTVSVRAYLTQIFELSENVAQRVTAVADKDIVFLYLTDPSQHTVLDVVTSVPTGELPSVLVQTEVCPTTRTYKSWSYQTPSSSGITFTTDITPVTEYCIVLRNQNPSGSYVATVTAKQTSRTNTPTNNIVTTDEYGDGVEPIEVAGIVVGVFIGIFSLIFFGWFLLVLLQMDREAWVARDPLQWGDGSSL